MYHRHALSEDVSLLLRHCRTAEEIQHFVMEPCTSFKIMRALSEQVDHPAWCLQHLRIGHIGPEDTFNLVKILSTKSSSLVSLWLWDCCFSHELLSVLRQNHGKTLQRMTVGLCWNFHKSDIEAFLSGCSALRLLDVFNTEEHGDLATEIPEECHSRWIGPEERVFKVFLSDAAHWTAGIVYTTADEHETITEDETMEEEQLPNDPWRQLQLMEKDSIKVTSAFSPTKIALAAAHVDTSLKGDGVAHHSKRTFINHQ